MNVPLNQVLNPTIEQRQVFFAGEYVSTKHGWMQGALYTGKEAANQLANSFHSQPM